MKKPDQPPRAPNRSRQDNSSTLPNDLKDLLEARLLEARAHPEEGIPWEEMKARLLGRA